MISHGLEILGFRLEGTIDIGEKGCNHGGQRSGSIPPTGVRGWYCMRYAQERLTRSVGLC